MTEKEVIESELSQMMNGFEKAAGGLLADVANKQVREFEGGFYGLEYGRPSKRLQTLLTVDREVLVVFTNFRSQQVRTIKFAAKVLAEAGGRLDPGVVMVAHCDEEGNAKLKKWGRESGLSVLPIFFGKAGFENTDIERALCFELYSHDPFNITGAVSDDSQFFGRRTEAITLARQLKAGQVRACLGFRKMGKTSVLDRIKKELSRDQDTVVLFIDASSDAIARLTASTLLSAIAQSLESAKNGNRKYAALQPAADEWVGTEAVAAARLIQAITTMGAPVVILFDEFDYLTPSSPTGGHWATQFNAFWRNFRMVHQEVSRGEARLGVMVSGVSSRWFRAESIDGVENAALMFVPEEYLGPLPRKASIEMIRKLSRRAGLVFESGTAGVVAEACGDVPLWMRKACSFIHGEVDVLARPATPSLKQVQTWLAAYARGEGAMLAEVALRHLLRIHPDLRAALELDGKAVLAAREARAVLVLERYGLLKAGGSRRLNGTVLVEGYALYKSEGESPEVTGALTDTAGALSQQLQLSKAEWLEELADINKRRNALESKTREIVLNFLRMDGLVNKATATVATRVLQVLDEANRKRLAALPADEIVKKLLWTDLVKVIVKEWALFERIFGDLPQFKTDAGVVNDRPDAHATDIDRLDVMYYRRTLKKLEGAIARLG